MSADAITTHATAISPETADFCLSPEEVSKGEKAVSAYLDSLKPGELRRFAEEALDTLAIVISGGICGVSSFPWQQVRAYHGALALSIVKEEGAPAHVETLRCRHDQTRKFQQVGTTFTSKQVQKMRTSLKRVIAECKRQGFISEDELRRAVPPSKSSIRRQARGRSLSDSEVRALLSACDMDSSVSGSRDALILCLAYQGGLRTVDLVNLTLEDLHFDNKTGGVTLRVRQAQSKRAKRITLENEELISLEDWLEARGRDEGPLFCPIARGSQLDRRRMTAADVRDLCDRRAVEAGVDPFAPNDLAKSRSAQREAARRLRARRGQQDDGTRPAHVSALFESDPETTAEPLGERIRFPYRVRIGG